MLSWSYCTVDFAKSLRKFVFAENLQKTAFETKSFNDLHLIIVQAPKSDCLINSKLTVWKKHIRYNQIKYLCDLCDSNLYIYSSTHLFIFSLYSCWFLTLYVSLLKFKFLQIGQTIILQWIFSNRKRSRGILRKRCSENAASLQENTHAKVRFQ